MSHTQEIFKLSDASEYAIAKCDGEILQQLSIFLDNYKIVGSSNMTPNIISTMGDKYRIDDKYDEFLGKINEIGNKPTNFSEIQCKTSSGIYVELNVAKSDMESLKTNMGRLAKSACKTLYDVLTLDEFCEYHLYVTTSAKGVNVVVPKICTSADVKYCVCETMEKMLPEKLKSLCTVNLKSYAAQVMLLGGCGSTCISAYKFYKDEDGGIECEPINISTAQINVADVSIRCRTPEHIVAAKKPVPQLNLDDSRVVSNLEIENNCDPDIRILKALLEILDVKYSNDRYHWGLVIKALSAKNKRLARWFSNRPICPFFDEFESEWSAAHNCAPTEILRIGSIYKWAKESNYAAYKAVKDKIMYDIVEYATFEYYGKIEDKTVAEILYCIFANKYVTIYEDKDPRWFKFVTKSEDESELYKWKKLKTPTELRNYISKKIPKIYTRIIDSVSLRGKSEKTEKRGKMLEELVKKLRASKLSLQKNVFITNIEKSAVDLFVDERFQRLIDSYKNIIGVGNGVLVMGEKCKFIAGPHDYYISRYTKTKYQPYDENNVKVQDIMRAFRDMIPEPDALEFALLHAATALDFNVHNILFAAFGSGSNGKSSWAQFIKNVMGPYASVFRMNLLTDAPEQSDKPNSARMMLKNKTWGFFDETDKCKKLNTNSLKLLVGDGEQSARNLHKPEDVFRNTASFFAASNYEFVIEDTDHGTWRRILIYYFKMRFCENPTSKFERKVNPDFIKKWIFDPEYLSAMLSIMVHYYEILQTKYKGILTNAVGPTIQRYTQEYRNKQDTINRFITEEIIADENEASELASIDIAHAYISWYKIHIADSKRLNVRDVVADIENSALGSKLVHIDGSIYKKAKGYYIKTAQSSGATMML